MTVIYGGFMWDQRKYDEEWAIKDALGRKDAALVRQLTQERDEWKRRGNAGKDPQEFAEWRKEAQP